MLLLHKRDGILLCQYLNYLGAVRIQHNRTNTTTAVLVIALLLFFAV